MTRVNPDRCHVYRGRFPRSFGAVRIIVNLRTKHAVVIGMPSRMTILDTIPIHIATFLRD